MKNDVTIQLYFSTGLIAESFMININFSFDFWWVNTEGNVWKICLHSVIALMSGNSLHEVGAIYEY